MFELPDFFRQLPQDHSESNEETRKQFDAVMRRSAERLETLSRAVKRSNIQIETSQRPGTPYEEIVKVAKEREVDLIVIATHGYTGLKHFLNGFLDQFMMFAIIAGALLVLNVSQAWLNQAIKIKLREALVRDLFDEWLRPRRAFRLVNSGEMGTNPDQRIQEDARHPYVFGDEPLAVEIRQVEKDFRQGRIANLSESLAEPIHQRYEIQV